MKVFEAGSPLDLDAAQWDALWASSPDATVFQGRPWMQAWFEVFCRDGAECKLIGVMEAGELVGLAPLVRGAQSALSPTTWYVLGSEYSDYHTFLVRNGSQRIVACLLDALGRHLPPGSSLSLQEVPQFSTLGLQLAARSARAGTGIVAGAVTACPTLRLRGNAGVARVLAKSSLRRHERDLRRLGSMHVEHWSEAAQIEPLLEGLFEQHVARWGATAHPSLFLNDRNREFYRSATRWLAPQGQLLFTTVRLDGRVVAQHFGLRSRNSLLWYKPAFDPQLHRCSPGEVLLRHLIESAHEQRLDELDFTRGDEPFKSRFCSAVDFNRSYMWHANRLQAVGGRLRLRAAQVVRKLRSRENHPPSPLGGTVLRQPTQRRCLVLDASTAAATAIARSLNRRGIEVDSVSAEELHRLGDGSMPFERWLDERDRARGYGLIAAASEAALSALLRIEQAALRARTLLPDPESLQRAANCSGLPTIELELQLDTGETPSQSHFDTVWEILCLYVHGMLGWYFVRQAGRDSQQSRTPLLRRGDPRSMALLQAAKAVLDELGWNGMATVTARFTHSGGVRLDSISPRSGDGVADAFAAGIDLPWGLWLTATAQRLEPQADF